MADLHRTIDRSISISRIGRRRPPAPDAHRERALRRTAAQGGHRVAGSAHAAQDAVEFWRQWAEYNVDFAQRSALYWDTLRQRGNQWLEHEAAGKPPVLTYKYETIADARDYARPANHALVRIIPPKGVVVDDTKRPFVIVDPRAGHGPGIGGSKEDSEVGVALSAGHPVYFVIFFPDPCPGQTLADVTDAEAEFIRIVAERHPRSQKPVIIGNCQGGWAVMMLAAARPDIAGPLVINGAPMSYWSGNDGDSPMRYMGGLLGGAWLSLFSADLGAGKFDGANLVSNFEYLNPANSLWDKWYHLFDNIDTEPERFLEFERWWGGFYTYNEEEIRWIVNNLFVGNKLSAGEARLGPGRYFDLKAIKQPIIVFASMGDNITPPQQAFNWIADVYSSTEEIKANGQTIVGLLHEDVGHLGIFVSGKVAKKEHAQIVEVLKYIQQLPPGLYGMDIEEHYDAHGEVSYDVTLKERKVEDLRSLQKFDRVDEKPFEAVAALSELLERAYSLLARPFVREMTPEWLAKVRRRLPSAARPVLGVVRQESVAVAAAVPGRPRRRATASRAPPTTTSSSWRSSRRKYVSASLDLYRDLRDATSEAAFFEVYGNMLSLQMADEREEMRRKGKFDPRSLPAVREVLDTIEEGSAIEGLARIAMLISKAGPRPPPPVADAAHARDPVAGKRDRAPVRGRAPAAAAGGDDRRRIRAGAREAFAAEAPAHAGGAAPRARAARPHRSARRPRRQAAQARGRTARTAPGRRAHRREGPRGAAGAEAQGAHACRTARPRGRA